MKKIKEIYDIKAQKCWQATHGVENNKTKSLDSRFCNTASSQGFMNIVSDKNNKNHMVTLKQKNIQNPVQYYRDLSLVK